MTRRMISRHWLQRPRARSRCLGTTNIIDNGHPALQDRVRRVKYWRSGSMAARWTAAAFGAISGKSRRIMGHAELWMLKVALDERDQNRILADRAKAG